MPKAIEVNKYNGRNLSVFTLNLNLPRHRWYPLKEGFSENLVREALQNTNKKNGKINIIDPFVGSGTTLVSAGRFGHEALGIEVNPFLAFSSSTKCFHRKWKRSTFENKLDSILIKSRYEIPSILEGQSTFTINNGANKWLFNRSVLRGFTAIDAALENSGIYRKPLRLVLFASLMDCCNAKRDGKCLRYRNGWDQEGLNSNDLRKIFMKKAHMVADDIINHSFDGRRITVIEGDTREKLKQLDNRKYDLLITSPPYLNSFDYSDVYRPELFVGGFIKNNEELRKIRLKTIRSHVQVAWEPSKVISSMMILPLIERLSKKTLWNNRLPDMVQSYFADMAEVLSDSARVMKPNAKAWIVVSTSAYGGVEIPVDLILADIACQKGWKLVGVYVLRQLRAAGQHWANSKKVTTRPLRESLIILQRQPR